VFVEGRALRVLVVGGGAVAARKASSFVREGAAVRVVAPELCGAMESLVAAQALGVVRKQYDASDIGDAHLVVAATNDRSVNAAVASDADAAGRLVNVADVAGEGTFSMMSAHRNGPLTIAVNAGGVPAASARIRDAVAERFGDAYADALRELGVVRSTLISGTAADQWRAVSDDVIGEDFCRSVDDGSFARRLGAWR
jgi:siroheme synthase-like protein